MNPTRRQLLAALTGLCAARSESDPLKGASAQLVEPSPQPLMGVISLPLDMCDPSADDLQRMRARLKQHLEEQGIQLPILILPPGVTWQTVTQENVPC